MPDGTLQFKAVVGEKATLWEDNKICLDDPDHLRRAYFWIVTAAV